MSDSVRPHRRQPTRLPRPWDTPGKNPGVGCHCLLQCMKVKMKVKSLSRKVKSDSQRPHGLQPTRLLRPWDFPRQEYWSGLPFPSPGDLPNPGIELWSPTLQEDASHLSHQGSLPLSKPPKTFLCPSPTGVPRNPDAISELFAWPTKKALVSCLHHTGLGRHIRAPHINSSGNITLGIND